MYGAAWQNILNFFNSWNIHFFFHDKSKKPTVGQKIPKKNLLLITTAGQRPIKKTGSARALELPDKQVHT